MTGSILPARERVAGGSETFRTDALLVARRLMKFDPRRIVGCTRVTGAHVWGSAFAIDAGEIAKWLADMHRVCLVVYRRLNEFFFN